MKTCGKWAILLALFSGGLMAEATEEADYRVIVEDGDFTLRRYEPQLVAETVVDGSMTAAGNKAFRTLFRYISGHNRPSQKIAMTAPVTQEGQKIAMTAPVGQQAREDKWVVSFMMPADFTLETLPEPLDPAVTIRAVPARHMAAVRYSGSWTERNYTRHLTRLEAWIREQDFVRTGAPVWARYNSPFTPWFLRKNEILIPVEEPTGSIQRQLGADT